MPERTVALDLDHTCLHHQGLLEAVSGFGENVERELGSAQRYLSANAIKFTCDAYLQALARPDQANALDTMLANQFANSYYDDVVPFLQWARQRSTLVIVTRGDRHMQNLKVQPIRNLVDEVLITPDLGAKGQLLKQHYGESPHLVFVDDRVDELDAAHESLKTTIPLLELFQIRRPDETHPYTGKHPIITNLNEIRNTLL